MSIKVIQCEREFLAFLTSQVNTTLHRKVTLELLYRKLNDVNYFITTIASVPPYSNQSLREYKLHMANGTLKKQMLKVNETVSAKKTV
jgi:hypothetical protein